MCTLGTFSLLILIRFLMGNERTTMDNKESAHVDTSWPSEVALVHKIDRRIIPTLFLAYFLQFLDKVLINVRLFFLRFQELE